MLLLTRRAVLPFVCAALLSRMAGELGTAGLVRRRSTRGRRRGRCACTCVRCAASLLRMHTLPLPCMCAFSLLLLLLRLSIVYTRVCHVTFSERTRFLAATRLKKRPCYAAGRYSSLRRVCHHRPLDSSGSSFGHLPPFRLRLPNWRAASMPVLSSQCCARPTFERWLRLLSLWTPAAADEVIRGAMRSACPFPRPRLRQRLKSALLAARLLASRLPPRPPPRCRR